MLTHLVCHHPLIEMCYRAVFHCHGTEIRKKQRFILWDITLSLLNPAERLCEKICLESFFNLCVFSLPGGGERCAEMWTAAGRPEETQHHHRSAETATYDTQQSHHCGVPVRLGNRHGGEQFLSKCKTLTACGCSKKTTTTTTLKSDLSDWINRYFLGFSAKRRQVHLKIKLRRWELECHFHWWKN